MKSYLFTYFIDNKIVKIRYEKCYFMGPLTLDHLTISSKRIISMTVKVWILLLIVINTGLSSLSL